MVELSIPKFRELAVEKIWPMIKEVPDLIIYFPDYKANQKPERKYMFQLLATLRYEEINRMLTNARKNRALQEEADNNEFVFVQSDMLKEIESVITQKCKTANYYLIIVTKGNAAFLLKRSAKLITSRKPAKEYPLSFDHLQKEDEEEKKKDDM